MLYISFGLDLKLNGDELVFVFVCLYKSKGNTHLFLFLFQLNAKVDEINNKATKNDEQIQK